MLTNLKISILDEDTDFKDTITVNLDNLPQLETLDLADYNKGINIVGNGVNSKFKQIKCQSCSISSHLLLLAL